MLSELKTFVAVARYGAFTRAGDRIGLTQSAVSGQIKRLERHLGFDLFERTARSARLNAAGQRTLERAEKILELMDGLGLAQDPDAIERLRVGAIASAQATLLAIALRRFRRRFANGHVRLVPGVSLHLLDQLDAGELDIAVIIRPPFDLPSHLAWRTAAREPFVLLVPETIEGDDWRVLVEERTFLRYDRTSFGGRQVERLLRAEGLTPNEVVELDELPAIAALVAQGVGVAIAPLAPFAPPPPPGVRVVQIAGDPPCRELGIAMSADVSEEGSPRSVLADLIVAAARADSSEASED